MKIDSIKVDPEFINMCFRLLAGEVCVNDAIRNNPDAAVAHMLALEKMRKHNEHFLSCMVRAHLFVQSVQQCREMLRRTKSKEDVDNVVGSFMAQAFLAGMICHEQLLDKAEQGLVKM
jgi:hypothetical protein